MSFIIKKAWMMHEGGTKYYRPILISEPGGRHCAVLNYGAYKLGVENARVIEAGQTLIKPGSEYEKMLTAKKARGYEFRGATAKELKTYEAFRDELKREFGARVADEITLALGWSLTGEEEPMLSLDDSDVPGVEPAIVERPESWGSWGA